MPSGNGSDGCDSTGASTGASASIASANPPVKHMPTTPTPGPPHWWWTCRARARSHSMTGDVLPVASTWNSRDTHAGPMLRRA